MTMELNEVSEGEAIESQEPLYTFLSANFANTDHTAIVAVTVEVGAVALSQADTPMQWAALAASGVAISPHIPPISSVVYAYQFKAALMNAGLYEKAAAAAETAGGLTWLAWQTATEFQRSSPNIATLAASLGLTDAQVDELFIAAAKITA